MLDRSSRIPLFVLVLLLAAMVAGVSCNGTGNLDPADDDDASDDDDDDVSDDDDLSEDDDDVSDDDDAAGTATIDGVVVRSIDAVEDGIGRLVVRLRDAPPGQGGQDALIELVEVEGADLSTPGAEVPFQFVGVEPMETPYFVIAFLDDDESGGPPGSSDLRGTPVEILVSAAESYSIEVVLSAVAGGGPGPGDDDDSAGDDDDSAGDDDDSAE